MPETEDYIFLQNPLTVVKDVSTRRAALLERCGVRTLFDALRYFPFRYENYTEIQRPDQIEDGKEALCYGRVCHIEQRKTRGRKGSLVITKVTIENVGSYATGVFFNQKWMAERFKDGGKVLFHGIAKRARFGLEFNNPTVYYLDDDFHPDFYRGKHLPVYHTTEGLAQRVLCNVMKNAVEMALPHFREYLPPALAKNFGLMDLEKAVKTLHVPEDAKEETIEQAKRRIIVDEFFTLHCGILQVRRLLQSENYVSHHGKPSALIKRFLKILPFELTKSQLSVLTEIKEDMLRPQPMHRLLQGDVGSGKTVVAATAMLMSVESGYGAAIMAPTEILAKQHYKTLKNWCDQLGIDVLFSSGSIKAKEKKALLARLQEPKPYILVGTHALLFLGMELPNLGLLIIDEQHKFGVAQRAFLREVKNVPDTLVMTATPIPRSLAMTLYGHLDISIIKGSLPGRKPVITKVVTPSQLSKVWDFVAMKIQEGRQAYVVYPQIGESDKTEAKAATAMYELLSKIVFPNYRIGLIHGRLKAEEKESVMENFRQGKIDILVCTTVIEVGVDVPNAAIMVIEGAERFGLAQLHQLRGRIGRGAYTSYCILVDNTSEKSEQLTLSGVTENKRLAVMAATNDGFEIAEADLDLRGSGEFFGERQSGQSLFVFANPKKHEQELRIAKELAEKLMNYQERGELSDPFREAFLTRMALRYGGEFKLPGF